MDYLKIFSFSFIDSFIFEHHVLFRDDALCVTSNL